MGRSRIRYTVSAEEQASHRVGVLIEVEGEPGTPLDLVLPSWVPGSYKIRDFARGLRDLRATAGEGGPELPVERIDKARWRVAASPDGSVRVQLVAYGHELITEGLDLTDEHLLLNAAVCLPYVQGRQGEPVDLVLHLPDGWKAVTELEELSKSPPRFRARDYDELVDSPVDCGPLEVRTLVVRGIPHRVVRCGDGATWDPHRVDADLERIVAATIELFGESPVDRFTFFVHVTDRLDGGLEHAASTTLVVPRTMFRPPKDYRRFLQIASHEYFHLYNVKRIRPRAFIPFDYTKEVYTRLLWWMEGTTDYYGLLILRRAGLLSPAEYLEAVAKDARTLLTTPGRHVVSLEEASFASWVDLYQPYEETRNQSVSYYVKGSLVSLALDLEIRARSANRSSLDQVLRALWAEHGRTGKGVEEDGIRSLAERVTGLDLSEFFRRYVQGTEELDLGAFARLAGLAFGPKPKGPDAGEAEPGYLGIEYEPRDGLVRLTSVLDGSPARRAGLAPGDELVAFDGLRVTHSGLPRTLEQFPPGTEVELTFFRRGLLTRAPLLIGSPPPEKYLFSPLEEAGDLARSVYEGWLAAKWEPGSATGPAPAAPAWTGPP